MLVMFYKIGKVHYFITINGFMSKQRMEDLQLWVCIVMTTSKMKILCHLADSLKKFHLNHMCSTIIFPHLANEMIHLWRCCRCGRHFLNFLLSASIQLLQNYRSLYVRILLCKVIDVLILPYFSPFTEVK